MKTISVLYLIIKLTFSYIIPSQHVCVLEKLVYAFLLNYLINVENITTKELNDVRSRIFMLLQFLYGCRTIHYWIH